MLSTIVLAPIRVVLVDDHRTVLWGLEKLILSATPRMQVLAKATCRAEALAALEKHDPNIVLLDLDLGEEDGLALIRELRKLSSAKVIILTGLRDSELGKRA